MRVRPERSDGGRGARAGEHERLRLEVLQVVQRQPQAGRLVLYGAWLVAGRAASLLWDGGENIEMHRGFQQREKAQRCWPVVRRCAPLLRSRREGKGKPAGRRRCGRSGEYAENGEEECGADSSWAGEASGGPRAPGGGR